MQLWSQCEESDIEDTMDAVEKRILGDERVGMSVLNNMGESWEERDEALAKRMWCAQFVQPEVRVYSNLSLFSSSCREF